MKNSSSDEFRILKQSIENNILTALNGAETLQYPLLTYLLRMGIEELRGDYLKRRPAQRRAIRMERAKTEDIASWDEER